MLWALPKSENNFLTNLPSSLPSHGKKSFPKGQAGRKLTLGLQSP